MLQFSRKHFDFNHFRLFFLLTLAVALVVAGGAAHLLGAPGVVAVIGQALVIAAAVGAVAGWMAGEDQAAPDADQTSINPANDGCASDAPAATDSDPAALVGLEEQGITVKLLELTALGDRYGNIFSVAMIGIDHLEDISEQYDNQATACLLTTVSKALAHTLRMPDRVGEFERGVYVVVLPETRLRGAIQIAERLRDAVSGLDVAVSDRVHIQTTASVGVTSFRRGDDLKSLVQRAEKALREAQKQGRNRVLPDMAA